MELRLAARRPSVTQARHWVADRARDGAVPEPLLAVVELLTSELVSNAVLHGPADGVVRVRTTLSAGHFTVTVDDETTRTPAVRDDPPDVPGGQGMRLVDRLASTRGVEVSPPGKSVWFRVALAPPGAG